MFFESRGWATGLMITIKNKVAIQKMFQAGQLLSAIFHDLPQYMVPGVSSAEIDFFIEKRIKAAGMVSKMKGYRGYRYVSCISVNNEVVHGMPHRSTIFNRGDLVKVDVCAAFQGYSADMARPFVIGEQPSPAIKTFIDVAQRSLDKGIACARVGNRLTDISAAIQREIEANNFGVVRDFAGHGIGKQMHEDPEILNYGAPGRGPVLCEGMVFAIEPMLTMGHYDVFIGDDGWTVYTADNSLAMHIEDTVAITQGGPLVLTRLS